VIVAVRLALLGLAVAAVFAAAAIGLRGQRGGAPAVQYACPMHPEVRAAAAGECPICRMALERVGRAAGGAGYTNPADSADLAAVENIRKHNIIDFVRHRSLLVPARELRGPASVDADGAVTALFYDDEIASVDEGERGTFVPADAPEVARAVRRLGAPPAPWDRSTARIRFELLPVRARGAASMAPGRVGWVELAPRPRQVLAVPASAVVQSPEGPYVLSWTGVGFEFARRPIEIGETFLKQGFAVVLSGLRVNERVVGRATFFLEADRRASQRASGGGS
jgi:hypothetical protein